MRTRTGLVVAATVLLLAGCSAPATVAGPSTTTASASASQSDSPSASPSPTLPADFPSDIPLIDGDILIASTTSNGWEVWISSSEPIDDFSDAANALQDAGFDPLADQSINGAAGGLFENDTYSITVTAGSDAEYQNAVGYQVEKK
ncbi:MAG TPA: hypothetical protein VGM38_06255 [Pseudolysinimonas sp.]